MSPPKRTNWGIVVSKGEGSGGQAHLVEERFDAGMDAKLETLKRRWYSQKPPQYPDMQFSVMAPLELVFLGRYREGFVLRLNDDPAQVAFLTNEMAAELARRLAPG